MLKFGYKVLRIDNGPTFWSATYCGHVTRYYTDRWSLPSTSCGPLAVFDTFSAARDFKKCYAGNDSDASFTVFRCAYIVAKDTELRCFTGMSFRRAGYLKYPSGTKFADKVLLLNPTEEYKDAR